MREFDLLSKVVSVLHLCTWTSMLSLPSDYYILDSLRQSTIFKAVCNSAIFVCAVAVNCITNYQQVPDLCFTHYKCPVVNGRMF